MDVFEYILDDEMNEVFAISLVDRPAIEVDFVALSKELVMCAADEEQHIVTGVALMPDIPIFRKGKEGAGDFYMKMNAETVKEAAFRFLERSKNQEVTLMHEGKADGVSVVESWVSEKNDTKLAAVGIKDIPAGSWCVTMRVQNPEVWGMVKDELLKGFSIEGLFKRGEKINFNTEIVMDEDLKKMLEAQGAILAEILAALKGTAAAEVTDEVDMEEDKKKEEEITALRSHVEELKKATQSNELKKQVEQLQKQIEEIKLSSVIDFEIPEPAETGFGGLMKKMQSR